MPRWEAQTEERLRTAAIELFLSSDMRTSPWPRSPSAPPLLGVRFLAISPTSATCSLPTPTGCLICWPGHSAGPTCAPPFEALVTALADVGEVLGAQAAPLAVQRREVIARSPELQERGRTKFAAVAYALSVELVRRGSEPATAALLADVGVAVFRTGFNRWVDDTDGNDLPAYLRGAGAELADAVSQP